MDISGVASADAPVASGALIPFNAPAPSNFAQVLSQVNPPSSAAQGNGAPAPAPTAGAAASAPLQRTTGASGAASTTGTGSVPATAPYGGISTPPYGASASPTAPSPYGMSASPTTPDDGRVRMGAMASMMGSMASMMGAMASMMNESGTTGTTGTGAQGMPSMGVTGSGATGATGASVQPGATATAAAAQAGAAAAQAGAAIASGASGLAPATVPTLELPFHGSVTETQPFGPTPYLAEPAYDGYSHFHTGIDYALPVGAEVDAAAPGQVVEAGWDDTGFGNRVVIDHGNGVRTLYGHLQNVAVHPGDLVQAGQEIGLSGSTGNSSGPHLHFGVQQQGTWVDPAPYLATGPAPAPAIAGGPAPIASINALSTTPGMATTLAGPAPMAVGGGAMGTAGTTGTAGPAGAAGTSLSDLVNWAATATGTPARLIAAVVQAESGGNPHAVSPVGAKGLMQLMDATAAANGVTDAFDPSQNVLGGSRYLKGLLQRYHGDESLAVAAYNAGPEAVDRYGGIPPYAETQQYVRRVLSLARQ